MGLARLPPVVRRTYERDRQQGLAPEQSGVFSLFNASYFMAELQEARLWERLEAARVAGRAADGPSADTTSDLWLEAETLRAVVSAGATEAQPLDDEMLGMWRNRQQL